MNVVAFRFFSSLDIQNRKKIRERYFEVKDEFKYEHTDLLKHFSEFFIDALKGKKSDFLEPDFPNAENYYARVHVEIPDDIILEELTQIMRKGLKK